MLPYKCLRLPRPLAWKNNNYSTNSQYRNQWSTTLSRTQQCYCCGWGCSSVASPVKWENNVLLKTLLSWLPHCPSCIVTKDILLVIHFYFLLNHIFIFLSLLFFLFYFYLLYTHIWFCHNICLGSFLILQTQARCSILFLLCSSFPTFLSIPSIWHSSFSINS